MTFKIIKGKDLPDFYKQQCGTGDGLYLRVKRNLKGSVIRTSVYEFNIKSIIPTLVGICRGY